MPLAREAFSTLGEVAIKSGRALTPADVRDVDILAIRSTTRVDRALLAGSRVRFVGTATIGTDHMDIPWLEQQGIRWCFAPGCNANSVAEYIVAALLHLARRHGFRLKGKTIGVIGVGNVGRKVVEKARALNLRVLQNDPPRARNEGGAEFVELPRLLGESDIVTLHVPLTGEGPDATQGMAGHDFFGRLKSGAIFINAARGPVMVSDELLRALGFPRDLASQDIALDVPRDLASQDLALGVPRDLASRGRETGAERRAFPSQSPDPAAPACAEAASAGRRGGRGCWSDGRVAHAVLDTWEGEPDFRPDVLARAALGTPHIAGHSYEGKVSGTLMVYREACKFLGAPAPWTPDALMPAPRPAKIEVDARGREDEVVLEEVVRQVYDITADDGRMRAICMADAKKRAAGFDELRRTYPERREFPAIAVNLLNGSVSLRATLGALGFRLVS